MAEEAQEQEQQEEVVKYTLEEAQSLLIENEEFISTIPKEKLPEEWFDTSEVKNSTASEIYGKTKKKIRGEFGLSDDEMNQISEEDQKDTFKFLSKAREIYDSRKGNVQGDADKLLRENGTLKDSIEEMQTSHQSELEQAVLAERSKGQSEIFDFKITQSIHGFKDFIPMVTLAAPTLAQKLKQEFDMKFEDGKVAFYEKGKEYRVKHPEKNGSWMDLEYILKKHVGKDWIEPKAEPTTTTISVGGSSSTKFNNGELKQKWEG